MKPIPLKAKHLRPALVNRHNKQKSKCTKRKPAIPDPVIKVLRMILNGQITLTQRIAALSPLVDHCARLLKEKETLQRQVERMQALAPKQSIAAQDQSPFEPFEYNSASSLARMEMSHKVIDIMQPPIPTLNFEMRQYPCGCSATGNGIQPLPDYCGTHGALTDSVVTRHRVGACTLAHLHRPGVRCGVCGETPDGFSEPARKL
jgi:hypothetical protein